MVQISSAQRVLFLIAVSLVLIVSCRANCFDYKLKHFSQAELRKKSNIELRHLANKRHISQAEDPAVSAISALHMSELEEECTRATYIPRNKLQFAEITLLVDIDKAAIFGNDGNDLGLAFQWMGNSRESMKELYHRLLNPLLMQTYGFLSRQAKSVRVVIYSMRSSFFLYESAFRETVIPLRWDLSWHDGAQIYLPPKCLTGKMILDTYSSPVALLDEEKHDLESAFDRLLITREVIREALMLTYVPTMVLSAKKKSVFHTAKHLGANLDSTFLWDDNPSLSNDPRVFSISPYSAMTEESKSVLTTFLEEHLPLESLEPSLIEYMLGADEQDRVIARNAETGKLEFRIPTFDPEMFNPRLRLPEKFVNRYTIGDMQNVLHNYLHTATSFEPE
ncbi:hypothetical protein GUITHDRAFT_108230 [Guillardia theta CCMP2712]|uniref:Uncharacterized protein n=1 Tax=Guillardia theta (strain CCMP2712) TaxID=905079 RepID=L1JBX4_GUITC|nr:hypothetical protein GUITHDRAFT_108230 [Guillardia theta CCMP2712]EKX45777.1 hypothetical protein GUITHDRAFT_108230 [Guillardia theta CCMP2712]|eukprot:XP_005832757.1 hypothetical protein GUITHDRAFT_108230 [Guillardia theta CCMP2712]